jgi:hypothetical protein
LKGSGRKPSGAFFFFVSAAQFALVVNGLDFDTRWA